VFCLIAGDIGGKAQLREEGFLVYDFADIEARYTAGQPSFTSPHLSR